MRYWWANQRQSYAVEMVGGYLWCQQRRANGTRNPFYDAVRLTRPGDMIFAYADARIKAVGLVMSEALDAGQPLPLAPSADEQQTAPHPPSGKVPGWLIDVAWLELKRPLHPAAHMAILAPLLPSAYAPLTPQGRGIQGGRLLELPPAFARMLLQLAGSTDPDKLVNPDWRPRQLRFSFDLKPTLNHSNDLNPESKSEPISPKKK